MTNPIVNCPIEQADISPNYSGFMALAPIPIVNIAVSYYAALSVFSSTL